MGFSFVMPLSRETGIAGVTPAFFTHNLDCFNCSALGVLHRVGVTHCHPNV
jgi:hypothetical protein